MDGSLLLLDRSRRSGVDGRKSGCRSAVPDAHGLFGGGAPLTGRRTPPEWFPAARRGRDRRDSDLDGVAALSVLAFAGRYSQAHLLAQSAADESAHAMGLPGRGFHDLSQGYTARALHEVEDRFGLATLANTLCLVGLAVAGTTGFLGGLGSFLGRAGLLPQL